MEKYHRKVEKTRATTRIQITSRPITRDGRKSLEHRRYSAREGKKERMAI